MEQFICSDGHYVLCFWMWNSCPNGGERSSLSLFIKEKDDQILSLHLLLQVLIRSSAPPTRPTGARMVVFSHCISVFSLKQKERECVAETKRKTEEMRIEMASLGSQKAELSRKVSAMRSTISSLREEQRAVASALQAKQNQSPQVEALKEELRQKQGEIEGLRLRPQLRTAEVGSNATMTETEAMETEAMKDASSENGGAADADWVREDVAKSGKEDGVIKVADDQEPEGTLRFREKHSYLMRAKGRRWRLVGKTKASEEEWQSFNNDG